MQALLRTERIGHGSLVLAGPEAGQWDGEPLHIHRRRDLARANVRRDVAGEGRRQVVKQVRQRALARCLCLRYPSGEDTQKVLTLKSRAALLYCFVASWHARLQ